MLDAFTRNVEHQDALLTDIRRKKAELTAMLAQVTVQVARFETVAQELAAHALESRAPPTNGSRTSTPVGGSSTRCSSR